LGLLLGAVRYKVQVDGNIDIDFTCAKLEEVDWINLAEDRDGWLALVKAINNFGVS
jgi:hypothetical protein